MLYEYYDEDVIDMECLEIDYPDEPDLDMIFEPPQMVYMCSEEILEQKEFVTVHPCRHNSTCSICQEPIDYTCGSRGLVYCEYQCGNAFHESCLGHWKKNKCPLCRYSKKPSGRPTTKNKKKI